MTPQAAFALLQIILNVAEDIPSLVQKVSQIKTMWESGRDPTPEELAALRSEIQEKSAAFDAAG